MKDNLPSIGILGGAGPLAGSLLMDKVIRRCQTHYRCSQDNEFPKMLLLSFPFSEMLCPNTPQQQEHKVRQQLRETLEFLYASGCTVIAIACNTLHGFLTESFVQQEKLLRLPELARQQAQQGQCSKVLTLCTSTAVEQQVHQVPAVLPDSKLQKEVDALIQSLLRRSCRKQDRQLLEALIAQQVRKDPEIDAVLLGCTELSVLNAEWSLELSGQLVIDPLQLAAQELCKRYFEKDTKHDR